MEFRLLGPLEVTEHDRSLALGGSKVRSVLALLLLHANEVVSTDRLIDELWGEKPPARADKSIQVHISRLRKRLGDGRVATRPPGYVLHLDPSELDLARFESLVAEAREAAPEERSDALRRALALWRGPALADLAFEHFAQAEIARLEELRLAALEQRIEADLASGRHAGLVAEIESLLARYPLRERLRGHLMLALYRSGRQAEALEAYRSGRRELSEQLGLEPSEELRMLEEAILRHDPTLDLAIEAPGKGRDRPDRSILIGPGTLDGLAPLLALAEPLGGSATPHELIVATVVDRSEVGPVTAALTERRERLIATGLAVRTAAFASPAPADDVVRLASQQDVDLLLANASEDPLEGETETILEQVPCDVALLVSAGGPPAPGPVIVPFGAAWHDWAALELAAWIARATNVPLQLIGAAPGEGEQGADASRLLADASLIVQKCAGVVAEPILAPPGREGIASVAQGVGLLVVGLSERWRQDGLGRFRERLVRAPWAPTVLVRRGPRPGGLAPPETLTHFGWSLTGGSS